MAFTVEDGTGVADANAYITVASADLYFSERGVTTWAGTDAKKEAWIIQATDYINARFGRRFRGDKEFPDVQAMPFPRTGDSAVETSAGLPVTLQRATAEYANRARVGALAPDPTVDASGLTVVGKRSKVGPIETETTFKSAGTGSTAAVVRAYPAADMLIAPLLKRLAGVIRN